MYFHGARFSNYEAWLSDPVHIKPSAQVVWPVVGQEILNGDVGGGFQGIQITSGFFQLWRASGITSELQLYTTAIGGLVMAAAMFFAGWFHYHKAAPKLEWFQNVESMLNHHLAGLLGLGSLSWAGHQIHVSLPVNKLLDAGVDPKEIPLPHEFLLNRSIMQDLYPSFAKGLAPFFTLQWGEYSDFLTFNGGLNPVTGGLWLSDTAHHHLAIAVLFLVAGHMYRTNWGIGHSIKEILDAHKGPFTGEGHVGLYELLTTSWHAQLAINLALFGSLSIIVAYMSMGHVKLFSMLEQPSSTVRFFVFSWMWNCTTSGPKGFFEIFSCSFMLCLLYESFHNNIWAGLTGTTRWQNLVGRVNQQEIQQSLDSSETTRRGHSLHLTFSKFKNWFFIFMHLFRVFPFFFPAKMFFFKNILFAFANQVSNQRQAAYNFKEFQKFILLHKHNKQVKRNFLEWFIGFTEGDGCFLIQKGRPVFVINQADLGVLNLICSTLGFGVVRTFKQEGRIYGRYVVVELASIRCLIALFNGNIQFEKVQKRFQAWVECYNTIQGQNIQILPKRKTTDINLQSAWLAGIFDSEGSFHSHIAVSEIKYRGKKTPPPNKPVRYQKRLYVKAYFDQQFEFDTLKQIANLFSVKNILVRDSEKQYYRIELTSKPQLELVLNYFQKYKLQSRKVQAFAIWKKIANLFVNSLHLEKLDKLEKPIARLKEMNALFKKLKDVLILLKLELEGKL